MSTETETTLAKMAHVTNDIIDGELRTPAVRLLRFHERQERQEEMAQLEQHLAAPAWAAAAMSAEGRRQLSVRKQALKKDLELHSPRTDLSGETKDALSRRQQVLEAYILQGMPTREEMRRNPPGAVDHHRNWNSKKAAVLEWKNNQVQLNPESDDVDLCNIERLRPSEMNPAGAATFMAGAQIPGSFAMTPSAKDNWPLGAPTATTATSHLPNFEEIADVGPAPGICYVCLKAPVPGTAKVCVRCIQDSMSEIETISKGMIFVSPRDGQIHTKMKCNTCGRLFAKKGNRKLCPDCSHDRQVELAARMRATRVAKRAEAQASGALP